MGGGGRCGDSQILFLLYSINVHKIAGIIFYRKEGKGSFKGPMMKGEKLMCA